ncbi:hypothetical protein BgiMline_004622 [Biomphalaria glabrata]
MKFVLVFPTVSKGRLSSSCTVLYVDSPSYRCAGHTTKQCQSWGENLRCGRGHSGNVYHAAEYFNNRNVKCAWESGACHPV